MDAVEINTSDPPQNEDGIVSTVEICRVCLLGNLVMRDLFLESEVASLSAKAMSFANVKILPDDGLPTRVCGICADKLESAYDFKLQVEQADTVLREKFVTMNMKEELFFNEVEVHLDAGERNESIGDIHMDSPYSVSTEALAPIPHEEKSSFLKDQLDLLQVDNVAEQQETEREQEDGSPVERELTSRENDNVERIIEDGKSELTLKCENTCMDETTADAIPTDEHDYILQQDCILSNNRQLISEDSYPQEDNTAESIDMSPNSQENKEENTSDKKANSPSDQDSQSPNETRRSKRKLVRRTLASSDRDSDEENYFENLNLSSRLKKAQASDKNEKIFFMCYLCDKQFLSKNVLKEHMHSHEEVRRALSFKRTVEKPEKPQKSISVSSSPEKMPPSGKKANKCPYCGKEYLYIISFSKHMKQHEREKEESMPLEVSFHEDEHSIDLDDYDDRDYSSSEYRKRTRRREISADDTQSFAPADEDDEERQAQLGDGDKERQKKRPRTEGFVCDKCPEKFYTRRGLQKHAITHISLKCNVCEEDFDSLERLRNHRMKHVLEGVLTEQDLEEDSKHTIERENQSYTTDVKDYEEPEDEDDDDGIGGQADSQAAEEDDEAELSSGERTRERRNGRNAETHSGISFSCKMCYQRFPRKDQLQRHIEQHARVKSYKCTQCNKVFGNELTLRNHLIATGHRTFIQGQEYDPNKRIKRVAARAAQKIIDKIKTEDGLDDYEDEDEDDKDDCSRLEKSYGRTKREGSSQKKCNYKKDLECASCNKRCSSKQSLTKHMEQHVKDEKSEKLENRSKKSIDKKDQQGNCGRNHGMDNEEQEEDDDSDFESGLDWPMDNHECTTCKKRYSTKKSLLRHQLLHEEPNFECDICNVKFYRKDKLKAHYDKCSEKNPDQVRKCNICGDSFENNEILREHRSKHVTEGILTEEDLRDIEPRPEEKKQGEKIGRKRRTDIVGLECTECNKQYTSRKGLLRHIQVHEGKKYLCDICPKKFYRREHLKIHVAKHNMIKPYKCTRCTKRFIKEEQLTNHLSKHDRTFKKNKETDSSKRFLCEICSKSFTQSTTLIAHLRAHNGIKPYVCEVCSRPFTTNAYLKMHMRTHTQERPYICQYCSRAFARADTLANHLTSHTGEAKYHCKYCPKNFRRLKSLKEHVFIHTGQRPYACPTCDRRFNNNGSRYAHSKRCKQNFVQNQNRPQTLTQVQTTTNQQRLLHQATIGQATVQAQVVKPQNIKTITISRQPVTTETVTAQQVMQHQEILMPLILPLTVTLTDVGEEVILPEGTKIFTTT